MKRLISFVLIVTLIGSSVLTGFADTFSLPASLETVESEAFSGIPAQAVIVPGSVTSIAYDAFYLSSIEYIYGFPGTRAETFADAYGFTFIPIDDAWMASH